MLKNALFSFLAVQEDCGCCNILQHDCVATEGQSGAPMWDAITYDLRSILTGKVCLSLCRSPFLSFVLLLMPLLMHFSIL